MVGRFLSWKVTIFASAVDKWLVRRCFEATQISYYSDSGVSASIDVLAQIKYYYDSGRMVLFKLNNLSLLRERAFLNLFHVFVCLFLHCQDGLVDSYSMSLTHYFH